MSAIKKIGIIAFLLAITAIRGTLPGYGSGAMAYGSAGKHLTAERGKQSVDHTNWIGRAEDEQEYRQASADTSFDLAPAAILVTLFAAAWLLLLGRSFRLPFNTYKSYQSRPYYLLFHSLRIPEKQRM